MQLKPLKRMGGAIATAIVALALLGCRGATGQNGLNGTNGTNGTNGSNGGNGAPGASYSIDATKLSTAEWGEMTLNGQVTSVSVSGSPVVNFKVAEGHGIPVRGLGFTSKAATAAFSGYTNMAFSIAKLVPGTNGSPSKWVSYIVTGNPTAAAPTVWVPGRPSTDNIGTLVDNGDGSYKYTFRRDISLTTAQLDAYTYTGNNTKADLGDVSYAPNLTHRVTVYVGGNARGTSTNTPDGSNQGVPAAPVRFPANFFYDFIPATGAPVTAANEQREIVSVDKCFTCHAKFEFHGEGRQDTRYCVVCHTDQRKYGYANATPPFDIVAGQRKIQDHAIADMPAFIHRLHMGEELQNTGYNYANVLFNEVTYPQDHRNCVKCHTESATTPQGNNWFNKPSRFACGGCHDKIDWQTGTGHGPLNEGGPQLNEQNCVNCHDAAAVKTYHIPVLPPNPGSAWHVAGGNSNTNASYVAAFANNLPAGASKVAWEIKSFTMNSSAKAVITFRFVKDGTPVVFNTYPAKAEMMDNFIGGPSIYVSFTVPYDGIDYPADWNASISTYLKNIWRGDGKDMGGKALQAGSKATLVPGTGADAGYYVLTFTDAVIPTNAGMLTAGIGYTYGIGAANPTPPTLPWTSTQPLTQTNVPGYPTSQSPQNPNGLIGGLSVPAPNVTKMVSGTLPTGFDTTQSTTPRRTIVATQKCNDCHGALGLFTAKTYHAGQRNDATTCEFCHNGQRVNSGWGVNAKDFVHAIHGAAKRVNKFSWEASAGNKYWTITYPGVLNNCEACHVPGSYDFGNTTNAGEVPNLTWTTVATGTIPNPVPVVLTGNEPIPGTYYSPFVTAGAVYGSGFSFTGNTGVSTPAANTTLVSSPYVAACSNCHDSPMAINHMKANGGSFYVPRSSVQNPPVTGGKLINTEQCFLCHSSGKIADVKVVHMDFK